MLHQRGLLGREITIGMVWDTISNNTGVHEGAVIHFELTIGRAILYIVCQKHMYDLHITHPYDAVFGKTKGCDNLMFKAFKQWYITQHHEATRNQTIFTNPATFKNWTWPQPTNTNNSQLIAWGTEILSLTTKWLTEGIFLREDYRENVELVHYIFGGSAIRKRADGIYHHFVLRRPGAIHHARFMGKSIVLKKYPLPDDVNAKIRRLTVYDILHFAKHFLIWPLSTAAPKNYLDFIYRMRSFRTVDAELAKKALESTNRHLW